MADLEEEILNASEKKPMIWWRYLDDIFFIWGLMTDLFVKPTDTHQFLDPSSSHPYHCKKGIPYSQALRLNRICSDNESFDKRCNDLEGWLMERGYNGKMIRKQILRAREHSRKDLLEITPETQSSPT